MTNQRGNSGIGIFTLIGVIFIVLKLCGIKPVGSWSWWMVTAPFWAGWAAIFLIAAAVLLLAVLAKEFGK